MEKKIKAFNLAKKWQDVAFKRAHSYKWFVAWNNRFYEIGKKYGLLRCFDNGGIFLK